MALVGSLVPGVEMATSRGPKGRRRASTFGGWKLAPKKSLRRSRSRTQTAKKQWAQGPIWILCFGGGGQRRIFAMPRWEGGRGGVGSMKTRCGVWGKGKQRVRRFLANVGENFSRRATLRCQIRFLRCSSSSDSSEEQQQQQQLQQRKEKKRRGATRKDRRRWLGQPGTAARAFLPLPCPANFWGCKLRAGDGWMERKSCYNDGDERVCSSCRGCGACRAAELSCRVVRSAPSNSSAVARTAKSGRERTGTG